MSSPLGPVLEVRTLYPASASSVRIASRKLASSSMISTVGLDSEPSTECLALGSSVSRNPPLPINAMAAVKIPICFLPSLAARSRATKRLCPQVLQGLCQRIARSIASEGPNTTTCVGVTKSNRRNTLAFSGLMAMTPSQSQPPCGVLEGRKLFPQLAAGLLPDENNRAFRGWHTPRTLNGHRKFVD